MLRLSALLLAALALGCAHARQSAAPAADASAVEAAPHPIPLPAPRGEGDAASRAEGEAHQPGADAGQSPAPPAPLGEPAPELPITFALVGDVMLGTAFPDEKLLPPDDGWSLLVPAAPVLAAADVAFANLEGPLADAGVSEKCARAKPGRCYAFRSPTRYAAHLERAGVNVVSIANNHIRDFGDAGVLSTKGALLGEGIAWSGPPGEIARLEVRGTRIALVAFSTSAASHDLRDVQAARGIVEAAARDADLVVVSFHGGAEGAGAQRVPEGRETFLGEDRGDLRAFARAAIDAGADLVVGHGPHVVRGMEFHRGRLVAYSLGNFATYGAMNLTGPNGLAPILEVALARDGTFRGGRIHALRQERPGGPKADPSGEVITVLRRLSEQDFGASAARIAEDGTIAPPPAPAVPGA
jgi:hypothetical protein